MTFMATPLHMVDPSLVIITYNILSLSDLCLGIEKKIFKEIMQFHNMTYMAMPQPKNPCSKSHQIYNFGKPFLGHHYYILSFKSDLCLGVEKKIFKEIMHFYYMTNMAMPLHKNPYPGGHEIYNFLSPYPTDATYYIWLRLAQQFLRSRC